MKRAHTLVIVAAVFTAGCGKEPEVHYADWSRQVVIEP